MSGNKLTSLQIPKHQLVPQVPNRTATAAAESRQRPHAGTAAAEVLTAATAAAEAEHSVVRAPNTSTLIATRVHAANGTVRDPAQLTGPLVQFAHAALATGCRVAVAVDTACYALVHGAVAPLGVHVLLVQPWGRFVPALNALVDLAADSRMESILFQSVELLPAIEQLKTLLSHLDEQTLVVGAAVTGHQFSVGVHELSGTQLLFGVHAGWLLQGLRGSLKAS